MVRTTILISLSILLISCVTIKPIEYPIKDPVTRYMDNQDYQRLEYDKKLEVKFLRPAMTFCGNWNIQLYSNYENYGFMFSKYESHYIYHWVRKPQGILFYTLKGRGKILMNDDFNLLKTEFKNTKWFILGRKK